jgi:tetratricopeptide (TPR) repeat protein
MVLRRYWWVLVILALAWQTFLMPDEEEDASAAQPSEPEMIRLGTYEPNLASQTETARSPLAMAAHYLEQGDEAAACRQLNLYLARYPDHFEVRIHLAELLLHQKHLGAAKSQFTRAIADAQDRGKQTIQDQLRCHTLSMEIAQAENDFYGVHFSRGVGLYLLALERANLPDGNGQLPVEGLLCRAAGELLAAVTERPGEAQAYWYLYRVWSALGQVEPAGRWLERAAAMAPFAKMTLSEQRGLQIALNGKFDPGARP